jgi:CheY-like chemotaxis protein
MTDDRPDSQRTVLLIGSDLMARERIRSAAAHLEMKSVSAGPADMIDALRNESPDVLVLDLDEGRESVLAALETARADELTPDVVIGFYSHVDAELGRAAEEAGCRAVRRGRFWASLPDVLDK